MVSFDWFNNTDVKRDRSVLDKKVSFKMLGLNFSSNLDLGWHITSIAETASENIGAFNCSVKFFSLRLLCISVNLPYGHAWNTVFFSGLVLLDTALNCYINYKNGYVRLLVHYLLLLLNFWVIVNM